jgi:alkylated DNA repair dioxygenase AlkB
MQALQVADGVLHLDEAFLSPETANSWMELLKTNVPWRQEKTRWGVPFPRLTAWYADPGIAYRYSGVTHQGTGWTELLWDIKQQVVDAAGAPFNSLLLNFYRNGQDSIGFHADDEPELGIDPVIASLSLGSPRVFILRHNTTGQRLQFDLGHGCLLVMGGSLQHHWKHGVPKAPAVLGERINLTFRNILSCPQPRAAEK